MLECILLNSNMDNSAVRDNLKTILNVPKLCFLFKIGWISRTYADLELFGAFLRI